MSVFPIERVKEGQPMAFPGGQRSEKCPGCGWAARVLRLFCWGLPVLSPQTSVASDAAVHWPRALTPLVSFGSTLPNPSSTRSIVADRADMPV